MSIWRKRQIANSLYIEHLQDRIRQGDDALLNAFDTIENLENKISKFEQDIELLTVAIRDLEFKQNSKNV